MRESEQVLFGLQSVFESDNAPLIVVSEAPEIQVQCQRINRMWHRGPGCQRSNEWEGVLSVRGKQEVDVFYGQWERFFFPTDQQNSLSVL